MIISWIQTKPTPPISILLLISSRQANQIGDCSNYGCLHDGRVYFCYFEAESSNQDMNNGTIILEAEPSVLILSGYLPMTFQVSNQRLLPTNVNYISRMK